MSKFQKANINSPARIALAKLIAARTEAAAEAREAQARIDRLAALATAAAEPRAALARLDAAEAQAFATWSTDPTLPIPSPDSAARIDLQREIATAQSKADAASRAVAGMVGEIEAARARVAAIDADLIIAKGYVALEEIEPIAASARETMARLADARTKGQALARALSDTMAGPATPAEARGAFAEATSALRGAFDLPMVSEDDELAFLASVRRLLAALGSDAGARLGEVA